MYFDAHQFDPAAGKLWVDGNPVRLRPKSADVLAVLLARAGEVVTKRELLETVWRDVFIGDDALARCISELRSVLGDDVRQPRFIVTAHRRGYRFAVGVSSSRQAGADATERLLVGRAGELTLLHEWWTAALAGGPPVAFVAGDAGIGKSMLVEAFVDELRSSEPVIIGVGQCVDQFGGGEPYLPFLDALAGMCRGADGDLVRDVLRANAPTWMMQLPSLLPDEDVQALLRRTVHASTDRMMRELVDALQAMSAVVPVVLVFEDLHAADPPSVELVNYLARHPDPARVLALCTYRSGDALARSHPVIGVASDLSARHRCRHLALSLLDREATQEYLRRRLAPRRPARRLVDDVIGRTEGNALFLATIVDQLTASDLLVEGADGVSCREDLSRAGIPESVRELIGQQLDGLEPAVRAPLEAAAVVGVEFTVPAVLAAVGAAADPSTLIDLEDRFAQVAQRRAVVTEIEPAKWPDGRVVTRYRFRHQLYHQVLYERLGASRRALLHRRIGEWMDETLGERARDVAAELAYHYARGGDPAGALPNLRAAAEKALERSGHAEALAYIALGLEVAELLPPDPPRWREVFQLRLLEAGAWIGAYGFGSAEADHAYEAAAALAGDVDDVELLAALQYSLWNQALNVGQLHHAGEYATLLGELAEIEHDPALRMLAGNSLGTTALLTGDPRAAAPLAAAVLDLYGPEAHAHFTVVHGEDPAVTCHLYAAQANWLVGDSAGALAHADAALAHARRLGFPSGIAQALWHLMVVGQLRGDVEVVHRHHAELATLCSEHQLGWLPGGAVLEGWATAHDGNAEQGYASAREALDAFEPAPALMRPYLLALVAEAALRCNAVDEAGDAVAAALDLASDTGEVWYQAELLRLRAEIVVRQGAAGSTGFDVARAVARALLQEALTVARAQGAVALEARAAASLARL